MNWEDAEMKLKGKPDGSFLVRDSSDPRYILSLSFRSQGITHHTRMEHYRGKSCCLWESLSPDLPFPTFAESVPCPPFTIVLLLWAGLSVSISTTWRGVQSPGAGVSSVNELPAMSAGLQPCKSSKCS